jgi:hypothetical protein
VIMNSADCIAQYRSYIDRRDAEPARKALAAEQREAAKVAREIKAGEVRARKEKKDAEKSRRNNLTPDELKAENKAKGIAGKLAKKAAAAEILQQLQQQQQADVLAHEDVDGEDDFDNLFD